MTKALVGSIQKFSTQDGPGIRTTVFLKGCPLNCRWCHNPEMISPFQQVIRLPNSCIKCGYCIERCPKKAIYINESAQIDIDHKLCDDCLECTKICYANSLVPVAREMTAAEVMNEVLQDADFYRNTGGGMTISGGELLLHTDFVKELLKLACEKNINVCIDTSGYGNTEDLLDIAKNPIVSDILYDMKSIDSKVHLEYTGKDNALILKNLIMLSGDDEINPKIQMRMPLIAGVNDSWEIITETAEFYKKNGLKKVTLLPYHSLGISKSRNLGIQPAVFNPPSEDYIQKVKAYLEEYAQMNVEVLA